MIWLVTSSVALLAITQALSLPRASTCTPSAAGNASVDDVPAITAAIQACGDGGTIVIPAGQEYHINSVLSFTGCSDCDFQVEGSLKVSNNLSYWEGKKSIISVEQIAGLSIRSLTGSGLLDGNGQAAWDYFASNSSYARPTFVTISNSTEISVSNLAFIDAPNVFHSASGDSYNIEYSDISLYAVSKSANVAHNTDGWDVGPASHVTITNAAVVNDDDCVAFKPGAEYVTVTNITCTGSHGLSVGSLGSKPGTTDTVSNVYVKGAHMINSAKAAGLKLYPGGTSHGTSRVSNVTWDGMIVDNCDYAFQVQSCYGSNSTYCAANPSTAILDGIRVINISGSTSSLYSPVTANLDCPANGTCDLQFQDYNVDAPSGTSEVLCANADDVTGITCTPGASG